MITATRRGRKAVRRLNRRPPKTPKVSRLQRNWRPVYIFVLIAIDSAAILVAGATAFVVRNMFVNLPAMSLEQAAVMILASCAVTIMIALISGVYRSACRIPLADQFRDAARAYLYSMGIIVFGMYLLLGSRFAPRFTAMFIVLLPLFDALGRRLLRIATRYMENKGYGRHNAMIVNWNGTGPQILDRFTMFPELGYAVKGFVCTAGSRHHCTPGDCTLRARSWAPTPMET
jgi:FlaA1/EpsC-like NDP-sugar epimerase